MQEDLKNYHAPRRPWPWIIAAVVFATLLAYVGPVQYAEELSIEAELKVMRAKLAAANKPQSEPAPIYCRGCRQFIAWKSDDGPWRCRCVDAELSRRTP